MSPNEFDTTKDPDRYVVWSHPNTHDVMGPANMNDGACYGRETICTCRSEAWASRLATCLNGAFVPKPREKKA